MRSTGLPPSAQTGTGTQAWWAPAQDQSVGSDNQAELHWPWLRAETAADSPDLRLLPDGLMNELGVADRLPMTAGSYTSPDAQASSSSSSRGGMFRPTGLQASSSDPSRQAVDAGGVLATSVAWPMGDLLAGSEGAGSLFGKLGSLAARAAPMAAGAASAAADALPFIFIPTNRIQENDPIRKLAASRHQSSHPHHLRPSKNRKKQRMPIRHIARWRDNIALPRTVKPPGNLSKIWTLQWKHSSVDIEKAVFGESFPRSTCKAPCGMYWRVVIPRLSSCSRTGDSNDDNTLLV